MLITLVSILLLLTVASMSLSYTKKVEARNTVISTRRIRERQAMCLKVFNFLFVIGSCITLLYFNPDVLKISGVLSYIVVIGFGICLALNVISFIVAIFKLIKSKKSYSYKLETFNYYSVSVCAMMLLFVLSFIMNN